MWQQCAEWTLCGQKKKKKNRPVEIDLSGNDAWNCWSLVTENKVYPSPSKKERNSLEDSNACNRAGAQDEIE